MSAFNGRERLNGAIERRSSDAPLRIECVSDTLTFYAESSAPPRGFFLRRHSVHLESPQKILCKAAYGRSRQTMDSFSGTMLVGCRSQTDELG